MSKNKKRALGPDELVQVSSLPGEEWREITFDALPGDANRFEISNYGRFRSFSNMAKGRVLRGGIANGYLTLGLKYLNERERKTEEYFIKMKAQVLGLKRKAKEFEREVLDQLEKGKPIPEAMRKRMENERNQYRDLREQYLEEKRNEERTRTINFGGLVHKMVAEVFLKKPSAQHRYVIHLDHDRLNNHYKNLKWATKAEVEEHTKINPYATTKKGRGRKPAENPMLTKDLVKRIKLALEEGIAPKAVARQYSVTDTTVNKISRGEEITTYSVK